MGDDSQNDDVREIMEKAKWLKMPDKVAATFNREVEKLKHINMQSPDYNVQLNYLQTLVSLPWGKDTKDNLNIKNAERILNRDHYGMEKVKEPLWSSGSGQDLFGKKHSRRFGPEICQNILGRCSR